MTSPLNAFLISRRRVLQGGAALSAVALAGRSAFAAPAKPLTFIGWQYHPEIVDQNVDMFKKLYDEVCHLRARLRRLSSCGRDEAHRRPARRHDVFRGRPHRALERGRLDPRLRRPARHRRDQGRDVSGRRRLAVAAQRQDRGPALLRRPQRLHLQRGASFEVRPAGSRQLGHSARRLPQAQEGRDFGRALQQRLGPEMARAVLEPVFLLVRGGRAGLRRQERLRRRRLPPQGPRSPQDPLQGAARRCPTS